jgi:hypothetical protein
LQRLLRTDDVTAEITVPDLGIETSGRTYTDILAPTLHPPGINPEQI